MASKLNEKELVQGLRKKSEESYRQLIEQYSEKLFFLVLRILRREEEAREVLQEAFLKVVTKIDSFHQDSSLYTWLYRITLNEALMRKRGDHSSQEVSVEAYLPHYEFGIAADEYSDWSKLPDQQFEKEELREFVRSCVEELPDDLKTAYVLKEEEGLSEDEVCEILEITKPAMKNRVHRARLILRKRIEERYVR